MGFVGHDQTAFDSKRRLVIAARFRRALHPSAGETFVVTQGLDGCVYAYPLNEWQKIEEKLNALPFGQAKARAFKAMFFHHASECTLDQQGRLLLPEELSDLANITEQSGALVKGNGDHLEIWNPDTWKTWLAEQGAAGHTYESIAEQVFGS